MRTSFGNSFLTLIVIISIAIIFVILFYFAYAEIARTAKEVALREIQNISSIQTHNSGKIIENALMDIVTNLKTIANSPTVQELNNTSDITLLLKAGQSATRNITDYYRIIDKSGKMIASSSSLNTSQTMNTNNQNFSNRLYHIISDKPGKIYTSDLVLPIIENPTFSISISIFRKDSIKYSSSDNTINDTFILNETKPLFNGALETSVNVDKLQRFIENSLLSSLINDITLLDRNGIVMFNNNKNLIGKEFFSPKVQSVLFNQLPLKEIEKINKLAKDGLNGKDGDFNLNATTTNQINSSGIIFSAKPIILEEDQFMTLMLNRPYNLDGEITSFLSLQRNFSISAMLIIVFVSSILMYLLFTWNKRLQSKVESQTITLNKNLEELRTANEQLKKHDKMQQEFINVAAHELRTPIQSLMGYTEMIKLCPDKTLTYIQPIERNGQRLFKLVQEILDITKLESGKLLLKKTIFDLNMMINDVIKDLTSSHKIDMTNSNVKLVFNPKESFTVYADKERIYQVTNNLVQNSIKFTTATTKLEARIDIILEREKQGDNDDNNKEDEMISIKIRDNGKGIDSEILPKLFSKFTTKSEYGGTGIGLYISKKIIQAHGGTIRGYNNPDQGATFEFTLPFNQKS